MSRFEQMTSQETHDDRLMGEFVEFVKQGGYSAEQMEQAYYRLLDMADEDQQYDPAIEAIRAKMQAMVNDHFPLDRFVTLVDSKKRYENMVETYRKFVDALPLSQAEKEILVSVVDKQRSGELEVYVDNEDEQTIRIRGAEASQEALASHLMHELVDIMQNVRPGAKIEIMFSE